MQWRWALKTEKCYNKNMQNVQSNDYTSRTDIEGPMIIPCKVYKRLFTTLYGIITGSLTAYYSCTRCNRRYLFPFILFSRDSYRGQNLIMNGLILNCEQPVLL